MVTDLAGRGARLGMVLTPRRPTAAAASTCPHKTALIAPRIPAPNISSTLCKLRSARSRKLCETVGQLGCTKQPPSLPDGKLPRQGWLTSRGQMPLQEPRSLAGALRWAAASRWALSKPSCVTPKRGFRGTTWTTRSSAITFRASTPAAVPASCAQDWRSWLRTESSASCVRPQIAASSALCRRQSQRAQARTMQRTARRA